MSNVPSNLQYTGDHEWVLVDGKNILIGITDHAQDQLGDIVYLGDFPQPGESVEQGDVVGVIESVKATSDIYSPITGKIVAVNEDLLEDPAELNGQPYAHNWILRIKITDKSELADLLDAAAYEQLIED
jgi:glycine cleavage system H protein